MFTPSEDTEHNHTFGAPAGKPIKVNFFINNPKTKHDNNKNLNGFWLMRFKKQSRHSETGGGHRWRGGQARNISSGKSICWTSYSCLIRAGETSRWRRRSAHTEDDVGRQAGLVKLPAVELQTDDGEHEDGEEQEEADLEQRDHGLHDGLQHNLQTLKCSQREGKNTQFKNDTATASEIHRGEGQNCSEEIWCCPWYREETDNKRPQNFL